LWASRSTGHSTLPGLDAPPPAVAPCSAAESLLPVAIDGRPAEQQTRWCVGSCLAHFRTQCGLRVNEGAGYVAQVVDTEPHPSTTTCSSARSKWGNRWGNHAWNRPCSAGRGRTCQRRRQIGTNVYSQGRTDGDQLLISGFWVRVPGGSPDCSVKNAPSRPARGGVLAVRTLTSSLTAGRLSSCRVLPANGTIVDDFYRSLARDVAWVHDLVLADGARGEATRKR
jgi:hypothetical protein